jgi:hypothetical protein
MTSQDNQSTHLAFIGQVWNQVEPLQLEQAVFELLFEGEQRGREGSSPTPAPIRPSEKRQPLPI